jgi:hypothetical protein
MSHLSFDWKMYLPTWVYIFIDRRWLSGDNFSNQFMTKPDKVYLWPVIVIEEPT